MLASTQSSEEFGIALVPSSVDKFDRIGHLAIAVAAPDEVVQLVELSFPLRRCRLTIAQPLVLADAEDSDLWCARSLDNDRLAAFDDVAEQGAEMDSRLGCTHCLCHVNMLLIDSWTLNRVMLALAFVESQGEKAVPG
jgi:hypothetical protein